MHDLINDLNVFSKSENEVIIKGAKFTDIIRKRNNVVITATLEMLDETARQHFMDKLFKGSPSEDVIREFVQIAIERGSIDRLKQMIQVTQRRTLDVLSGFEVTPAINTLTWILEAYDSERYWMSDTFDT